MLNQAQRSRFQQNSVSEIFNLFERVIEHKLNATRVYVYNVGETALTTF